MTNLVIARPQIWTEAVAADGQDLENIDERNSYESVVSGPRHTFAQRNGTSTNVVFQWNMASSASREIEFCIVAHARTLLYQTMGAFYLQGSTNNSTWTTIIGQTDTQNNWTLMGPRGNDVVMCSELGNYNQGSLPDTTSYRYYRVLMYSSAASYFKTHKLYFGSWFDMGRDPASIEMSRTAATPAEHPYDSGGVDLYEPRLGLYEYSLSWEGVSDAKAEEFMQDVVGNHHRHKGLFLVTLSNRDVLDRKDVVHVELLEASSERPYDRPDTNTITATFREMI